MGHAHDMQSAQRLQQNPEPRVHAYAGQCCSPPACPNSTLPLCPPTAPQLPADQGLASALLVFSAPFMHSLKPRELASMLWSAGKLGVQPHSSWWDALWEAGEPGLGALGASDLAVAVYGLASLQVGALFSGCMMLCVCGALCVCVCVCCSVLRRARAPGARGS